MEATKGGHPTYLKERRMNWISTFVYWQETDLWQTAVSAFCTRHIIIVFIPMPLISRWREFLPSVSFNNLKGDS